jgi:hypothetical protein
MVYTPEYLSEYVARKTKQFIEADTDLHNRQVLTVADPAVGEDMLLESLSQNLPTDEKLTPLSLCGIDIDSRALASCRRRLQNHQGKRTSFKLVQTNSLKPFGRRRLSDVRVPDVG